MPIEVILPKFGFTQETAEIVAWLRQEGDWVEKGDPIAEVTTDKVNMEVEAPASGVLSGLRFKPGDVVPVTEVIAYILERHEVGQAQPTQPTAASAPAAAPASKPDGQAAVKATPLAERIARAAGLDLSALEGTGPGGRITRRDVEEALGSPMGKVRAAPAARRRARELGVPLQQVVGTGPQGRIQTADVERAFAAQQQAAQAPAAPPTPAVQPAVPPPTAPPPTAPAVQPAVVPQPAPAPLGGEVVPLVGMRRTIAQRLQRSAQEAPHIHLEVSADVTQAEALRQRANAQRREGQAKVSLTAVLVKACAWTLRRHPKVNAWFQSDAQGERIVLLPTANVGVAVALPDGLIVPVVRNAEQKGLWQIAQEVEDLVQRARQGKLSPQDVQDGTFTVSNLGMLGISRFTAIINPPQVAILAVGAVRREVTADEQGAVVVRPTVTLTLCADHRAVDGAVGAYFLADLKRALEDPQVMLL